MHCQILLSRNEFGFRAESDIGQEDRDACRRQLAIGEDQIGGAMPVAERFPVSQAACRAGLSSRSSSRSTSTSTAQSRCRRPRRRTLRLGGRMKDHDRNSANFHVRCLP
jgi:hypothetical protein